MAKFNFPIVDLVLQKHLSVVDHTSFFQNQRNRHWTEALRGSSTDLAFVSKAGVLTSAHQAVVFPLSPLLANLVASSQCCPQHLSTLILPDWDAEAVRSLLQLVYTGSVVVKENVNKEMMELIKELGLRIDGDRISEEWMHQRTVEESEDQTTRVENITNLGSDSRPEQQRNELVGFPMPDNFLDTTAETQINCPSGETFEQAELDGDMGETVDIENDSNDKVPYNLQTFSCVNCRKTFSEEKVTTYILHERNCKERPESENVHSVGPSQDFKDYQISVPNFYGRSLQNRESVYDYVDNEAENLTGDVDMDIDAIVKKEVTQGSESDEDESSWKKVDVCIICQHNLVSLDMADRGAHFYFHFKRQLINWLDGMLQVYFCDPKKCPQCDVKFGTKKALCKHVGTVHNLYQTFLNRYNDGDHDLMPSKAFQNRKDSTSGISKTKRALKIMPFSTVNTDPDVNGNISKSVKLKRKGGKLKQVKIEVPDKMLSKEDAASDKNVLINNFVCQLCNKICASGGLLMQHSCVHFKKELKQGYPNIFSNKRGEMVTCPKCNKGPMKKANLLIHIGATHEEVTKYAPWAQTNITKHKQKASTVKDSEITLVTSIDDEVDGDSEYKNGAKKRKLGKMQKCNPMKEKLSAQSSFKDTEEIENAIPNSEKENPMKRKKRSCKPMFSQVPRTGQTTLDQNSTAIKIEANLPECITDITPSDVEQEKTSVLVAWKESDDNTLVMDSTGLLDPDDLSQLVASARLALSKQGK